MSLLFEMHRPLLRSTLRLMIGSVGFLGACGPLADSGGDANGAGNGDGSGSGNSATITIGEAVYTFDIDRTGQCTNTGATISGTFSVDEQGNDLDGGDASRSLSLSFLVSPPDWEARGLQPPQISVDDSAMNVRWQAGGLSDLSTVSAKDSELLMWTLQGGRAQGTATFIDLTAQLAGQSARVVSGSFDIRCGE